MKRIIFALFMLVLLTACTVETQTEQESQDFQTEEAVEEISTNYLSHSIRITNNGVDPTRISAVEGDLLLLEVTNTADEEIRFQIEAQNIDRIIHKGNTDTITIRMNRQGSFEYGDFSKSSAKIFS